MITSNTSRIALKNLLPGQKYAVQVRAVGADGVASLWSRKFTFTTVTNDRKPQTPINVTWEPSANSFTGKWTQVTKDVAGEEVDIARYEVELYSEGLDRAEIISVMDSAKPSLTLGIDRNRALFGVAQNDLSMRVRAVSTRGLMSDWSESHRAANNPPAQVQNVVATPIVDGVTLSWDANSEADLAGYRVYVGPDRNITLNLDTQVFEGDATTYTYFTMTYAEHSFAVTAFDEFGIESEPAWVEATPISPFVWDDVPPEVPTGLAITRDGSTATVTWTALADDDSLAGYDIMYIRSQDIGAVVGQDAWLLADMVNVRAEEGSTKYITGLDPHAAYQFKVRAYDKTMNFSDWSEPVEKSGTPNVPPAMPTNMVIEVLGQTIRVTWARNSEEDVVSYALEVDRVNTFDGPFKRTYNVAQSLEGFNPTQDVPKLAENTLHYLRLRAVDRYNAMSDPATASATTELDAPPLTDGDEPQTAPAIVLVPGIGYVTLDWDAVPNADPVTYEVHVSTTASFVPDSTTLVLKTSSTGAFLRTDAAGNALAYGTAYYFKVIPTDGDGPGPASNEVSGSPTQAGENDIISLNAGAIKTGTLDTAIITLGPGGVIKSSNYGAGTGFQLTENSLIINDGTVSAAVLKGGTVSSTTINIGSGGALVVDSTAVIKSSTWDSTTTDGWRLTNTGLEVRKGSVSASAISAGTFSAGAIYVASGGGIYDANGYWSITPSSINISNGSINAGAITSGTLRSNAYSVNADGSTNTSYWAWSLDKSGNAVFGNTYVRGRMLVDSGVVQSGNYFAGSSGWRIDSNGQVYFNQATINAGTFKSQNTIYGRVELGNTGPNDLVDELRMWNDNSQVSSLRNKSGEDKANFYMSLAGGGAFMFYLADWPMISPGPVSGAPSRPSLKFASGAVQVRRADDGGYGPFAADTITAVGELKTNTTLVANGNATLGGQIDAINMTTGTGTNITWNSSNGRLRVATSSKRFKENIRDADFDTAKVLALRPRVYQRNDDEDNDGNILPVTETSPWYTGFIAEEAEELGLDYWVVRDQDGKPFGFSYDSWTVAHQVVLREHDAKIQYLESRIETLENLLAERA